MSLQPEQIAWTRNALERLFDLAFLRRHAHDACVAGRFPDGHVLQELLLGVVKQLKPPLNVPAGAPVWRVYNVLNLRYVQGLSQAETAAQLNIGPRQMRREQQRAIQAVADLLFDEIGIDEPINLDADASLGLGASEQAGEFTHLDDLLHSTLGLFESLLEQQGLHVTVATPPSLPAVRANQMVLRQLLVSAVSWLIRDVKDVTVTITAVIERGRIAVSMWKPPPEVGSPRDPAYDALSTAQQLAELLGVEIERLSDAEGARLQFVLPTNEAQCVLMIDDNPHAIQLVQRYLQQSTDFYLIPVSNPREALRQVVAVRPDCILLDVMMPERDGWELLTLFRTHPEVASIPVIVSSVLKEDELARSLGAAAVLIKPYRAEQLLALLRSVIGQSTPVR